MRRSSICLFSCLQVEDPLCILAEHQVHLILVVAHLRAGLLYSFDRAFRITDPMCVVSAHDQVVRTHPFKAALHSRAVEGRRIGIDPGLVRDVG